MFLKQFLFKLKSFQNYNLLIQNILKNNKLKLFYNIVNAFQSFSTNIILGNISIKGKI